MSRKCPNRLFPPRDDQWRYYPRLSPQNHKLITSTNTDYYHKRRCGQEINDLFSYLPSCHGSLYRPCHVLQIQDFSDSLLANTGYIHVINTMFPINLYSGHSPVVCTRLYSLRGPGLHLSRPGTARLGHSAGI